jgi:hypothetical protein
VGFLTEEAHVLDLERQYLVVTSHLVNSTYPSTAVLTRHFLQLPLDTLSVHVGTAENAVGFTV